MKVVQIINRKKMYYMGFDVIQVFNKFIVGHAVIFLDIALYKSIPSPMHEHNESITVIFTSLRSSSISSDAITAFWKVELKPEEKAMCIIFLHTFIQSSKKLLFPLYWGLRFWHFRHFASCCKILTVAECFFTVNNSVHVIADWKNRNIIIFVKGFRKITITVRGNYIFHICLLIFYILAKKIS